MHAPCEYAQDASLMHSLKFHEKKALGSPGLSVVKLKEYFLQIMLP